MRLITKHFNSLDLNLKNKRFSSSSSQVENFNPNYQERVAPVFGGSSSDSPATNKPEGSGKDNRTQQKSPEKQENTSNKAGKNKKRNKANSGNTESRPGDTNPRKGKRFRKNGNSNFQNNRSINEKRLNELSDEIAKINRKINNKNVDFSKPSAPYNSSSIESSASKIAKKGMSGKTKAALIGSGILGAGALAYALRPPKNDPRTR